MRDKEQINKCECTCDECGAECEPFWKKENKEQIIIDGANILKEKKNMCFILLLKNKLETPETIEQTIYEHLDAFVKEWDTQLARKTQECEELRVAYNRAQDILGRIDRANELKSYSLQESIKECDRYLKALEEIEEVTKVLKKDICNNCGWHNTDGCNPTDNVCGELINILDIINKIKGKNNVDC